MREVDGAVLRRWVLLARDRLADVTDRLDALNVFPVADADTGTNLSLTARAAADEMGAGSGRSLSSVAKAAARGALAGARGNSGTILAAWWQGFARTCESAERLDGPDLARALTAAADRALAAVPQPVEGTILTASRAAAEAAQTAAHPAESDEPAECPAVALAAVAAADTSATASPTLNPLLGGVVDAGAAGLAVVVGALAEVLSGEPVPIASVDAGDVPHPARPARRPLPVEVQFALELDEGAEIAPLVERLDHLGDSVVVAGEASVRSVHVHVDLIRVGAVVEAALAAGRPYDIQVTTLDAALDTSRRVVAVAEGDGLRRLLADAGAEVVDTADLVRLLLDESRGATVVLPGDPEVLAFAMAAARTAGAAGSHVTVLQTRSPVQTLAAVAVHDPARPLAADVAAMSAAAGATRWAAVVRADEVAQTSAGVCRPGDLLGVVDGDVAVLAAAEAEPRAVALEVLDRMLGAGGELVTVLTGADSPEGIAAALCADLARSRPEVEVMVHDGGQQGIVALGVE